MLGSHEEPTEKGGGEVDKEEDGSCFDFELFNQNFQKLSHLKIICYVSLFDENTCIFFLFL